MFEHPRLAGSTGVVQHVFFWKRKPGIQKLPPIYPSTAKAAHVSGTVQVIASVAVDGQVLNVTPVSGHPMLVNSAVDSVKQWIYPQVRINGEPEPFHAIIDVNFRLP
jgi:protein TonB